MRRLILMILTLVIASAAPSHPVSALERYVTDQPFLQKFVDKYTESSGLAPGGARVLARCGTLTFAGTDSGVVRFTGQAWEPAFNLNAVFPVASLTCNGTALLAAGPAGLMEFNPESGNVRTLWKDPVQCVATHGGEVFAGTENGLLRIDADGGIHLAAGTEDKSISLAVIDDTSIFFVSDGVFTEVLKGDKAPAPETDAPDGIRDLALDGKILRAATDHGIFTRDRDTRKWDALTGKNGGLPYEDVTSLDASRELILAGFPIGAAFFNGEEWHYFESGRYLADDFVTDVLLQDPHTLWIANHRGITRVRYEPMTMSRKAAYYQDLIPLFNRMDFVGDAILDAQGDMASIRNKTHDNENVWTGMYTAAECFRFAVTGDPQARLLAQRSLQALLQLEAVTGIPGYFARSMARPDEDRGSGGEWHLTPDGQWWWKSDTSSDELAGRFFGFSVYHDLCADAQEKQAIAASAGRTMRYIIDNDYFLIDVDGEPTRWGRWNPDFFKKEGKFQKNLNSLEILSFLKTAHTLTGDDIFFNEYKKLISEYGYAKNARMSKINQPGMINHSDDLLAFLSYYPLLKYERTPFLLENYFQPGIRRTWQIVKKEKNPLWNFIYGAVMPEDQDFDAAGTVWTLQRMPLEMIYWPVKNSHRADIAFDPYDGMRPGEKQSLNVLPPDERFMLKFNENPFRLDGYWNGDNAEPPSFWLLPYWMGRYYGFIREPVVEPGK